MVATVNDNIIGSIVSHTSSIMFSLLDVNECNASNGGCNQVCINVIGSFLCSCNTGYELDTDQRTCVGMFKV